MEYGLTLTGGGARGAYHAGVYRALREMDKRITAVTGTSIGAVTAALIAAGENRNIRRIWNFLSLEAITGKSRLSLNCSTDYVKEILDCIIDEDKIRKSNIIFGFEIMCPRKRINEELFIDEIPYGTLTDYLTAAVCLPVFKAKVIGGSKYIDGGIIDNAPFDMLIRKGCRNIIISDDHGIGRERPLKDKRINLIRIRLKKPCGGILNFDKDIVRRTILQGYFDCLHELGAVSGEIYAFENEDYLKAVQKYGRRNISRLEKQALKCGISPLYRYSTDALAEQVRKVLRKH
ncbi:MAG: patatin-like phospholipase family protein [bacterium]|nr:patatin-like phospholipase family protein [bacterium]